MSNFLTKMLSLGVGASRTFSSAQKQSSKAKEILNNILDLNKNVPIEDFLKMYDMRMYDISSKQDDIKFMKTLDFEGVYILYNKSKNKYYIGKASKVFRKIERHFAGYENEDIYSEWKQQNEFFVNIVRFENSGYENIDALECDIKKRYSTC